MYVQPVQYFEEILIWETHGLHNGFKKTSKTKWFQLSDISVPHKLKQHFLFYQRLKHPTYII